jgi:hypothetical protein
MSCKIKMGVTHLMRGVTFPWRRGLPPPWRGKRGRAGRTLPWDAAPFSYIYVGHAPLLHTLSCFHPLPCCSTPWLLLKRSAAEIVSHQLLEEVEEEEEFQWIPTSATPLDRGHGGHHWTVRVTEYGGAAGCGALYMILRSSSERLRRLRQVNDYVGYVHLRWVFIDNACAGT